MIPWPLMGFYRNFSIWANILYATSGTEVTATSQCAIDIIGGDTVRILNVLGASPHLRKPDISPINIEFLRGQKFLSVGDILTYRRSTPRHPNF